MSERVVTTIEDQIAHVRLSRPEKHNALDREMFRAIVDAGTALRANTKVRAVVMSGAGPSFCAGLDFQSFAGMSQRERNEGSAAPSGTAPALRGGASSDITQRSSDNPANFAQQVGYVWKQVPVPVICALQGVAYGGGLQLALGADIRLAHPDAKLSVLEIKWGLVPDMSGTQTLRDLVRLDVAKELTWTGRIVGAKEAAELGLVTRVCDDPLAEAFASARAIALRSPTAIRFGKQLLETAWRAEPEVGLKLEERLQLALIGSPNQTEAVRANFEKRDPKFEDPS
jgi:enoyl-CoA hydratase/carnithine racemase